MKRALSVILTLAMLLSMCTVFFVTSVAAVTVISNTSPAITADVGETITLSDYAVTFDGDTAATSGITWKNGSDTVTTFTPDAKGVTALTATSGSKTKTIYVVAKEANETEYVLYEANMADFATTQALTDAGWTLYNGANTGFSKASDGSLVLSQSDRWSTVHAYLPAWLGDFGDYAFEADVKILSVVDGDTARWLGIMHRSDNLEAVSHYSHMCVREAANGSSGVEYGERFYDSTLNSGTGGDNWNVMVRASASNTTMSDIYRTVRTRAFGKTVSCELQNKQMIYISDVTSSMKEFDSKGYLGLIMCGGELAVKSVKVTVQESAPEEVPSDITLIYNNHHDADNLLNAIANVQRVDPAGTSLTTDELEGLTVAFFNASSSDGDVTANMQACIDAGVVPTIYVATNAQADAVVSAVNAVGICDVNVMSSTASVLKYIRGKNSAIRTGLRKDISSYMTDGILTDIEANEIRLEVRSCPATYVVIDSEHATKQAVAELQKLAVSVWAVIPSTDADGVFRPDEEYDLDIVSVLTAGVNGIITRDAINVNNVIKNTFEENSMTRTPLVIGHRGNPSVAPENTIESFQAAYENGADVFELDVNRTKDGVIVVLHDDTLNRTTTYTGSASITEMTWAQVQQYYVLKDEDDKTSSTGKPIPTLDEVVKWAKGKDIKLFVEFKWGVQASIAPTMQVISNNGMNQQVDVISFMGSYCTLTQSATPGMSTGWLVNQSAYANTYGQALAQLDSLITEAQSYNSTVNPGSYDRQISKYSVQAIADRGLTIWPWTYNEYNTGGAFIDCPDGITSDDVDLVKNMAKLVTASDFYMCEGQTYVGGNVKVETHGNQITVADNNKLVAKVVYGDAVAVENGKLVAKKAGTASVIFGYRAATYDGREYVLYTQPVTVTVDGMGALKSLVDLAKEATVKDFNDADLEALRELCSAAEELIANNSTDNEAIMETALDISELLNNKFGTAVSDVNIYSYDTSDSNYYKWDSAAGAPSSELDERYVDDHACLIDGVKNCTDTETKAYDVWQNLDAEITLNLGSAVNSNVFSAYFAAYAPYAVLAPKGLTISYKDASGNWIDVSGDLEIQQTGTSNGWGLYKYTVTTDSVINAQYVKITVIRDGIFVWMDEVEVQCASGGRVSGDYIYVTHLGGKVDAGNSILFTEGTVTAEDNNHKYTANIEAEWSDYYNAYVVTSVTEAYGDDTPSVTVGDGKILLAVHGWDSVVGSTENKLRALSVKKGQLLIPVGMDVESTTLGIAPYFTVVDSDHTCSAQGDIQHDETNHWYVCECGEIVDLASHTTGEWVVKTPATLESEGLKEKYCTECEYLVATEAIPQLTPDHVHEAVGGWMNDESNHWKECVCGNDLELSAHTAGEWATVKEAEIGVEGKKELRCSVCWAIMDEEIIPALKAEDDDWVLGDVNRSGDIDMMDYILLKRNYFGTFSFDEDQLKRGDCNKSGVIDMMDYILLKRAYFGTFILTK